MIKITNLNDIVKRREERERKEYQDKITNGINQMLDNLKKKREVEKKNRPLSQKILPFIGKVIGISLLILVLLSIAALIKLILVWLF